MQGKYYDEQMECMSADAMRDLQSERLVTAVGHAYKNVGYYRDKMKAAGLEPGDIKGVDDLSKLPFTTKDDLRDAYPYQSFAVPMDEVVRIHASSGTTGKSTVVGYTEGDLRLWSQCVARGLVSVGASRGDILHVAYGYGLFTGGLGLHDGATMLGAAVIPVSGGNTARQIQIMRDFGPTILACTPSYALYLGDELRERGLGPDDIKLRVGIFGAEPWTDAMRDEIERRLGISAYNIYGLSEISGPGVSQECAARTGMHIQCDHFLPEIIDADTGAPADGGAAGELVISCITKRALPLIRYRTRDITRLHEEKCACGRTTPRMERVMGRSDDMLIIRGVNVFPSQIETVLLRYSEVEPHYMIYVRRDGALDELEVHIELTQAMFSDEVRRLEGLSRRIRSDITSTLGVSCGVKLVEPKSIPRSEGKAVRVTDLRKHL